MAAQLPVLEQQVHGVARPLLRGPDTLKVRYQPTDEIIAFRRDLDFVRRL